MSRHAKPCPDHPQVKSAKRSSLRTMTRRPTNELDPLNNAPTTDPDLLARGVNPEDFLAWQKLWEQYREPILRACQRSGLTQGEAEEIVQEVFGKLTRRLRHRPLNPRSESLRAWLSQTTHHQIFERHRLRRRHPLSPSAVVLLQEWLPATVAPDLEAQRRERMEGHLWSVCLARVRSAVSPRQWQIFEAYVLEGMPSTEVARIFDTSSFNVRQIRLRLAARLRQEWSNLTTQFIEPAS